MTRPRVPRRALAVALAAVLVAGSAGAAFGYWVSAATATATLTTTSVAVSQAGFGATAATYRNHELTSTGGFSVTNTGQTAGSVSLALAATSGGGFAAAVPVAVWPVAAPASCTPAATVPGGAVTGTWAAWSWNGATTLAPGASAHYCVRTVVPTRQSIAAASGTQTAAATLTVTLDDAVGWVGTVSATGTATRTTELIYPAAAAGSANYVQTGRSNWFTLRSAGTSLCLDVSASGGSGTRAISWTCHDDANQRWEILPDGTNPGLVRLRPKHSNGLAARLTVTGSAASIATADGTAAQLWEIQRMGDNAFQLVAHTTGQCLTMSTTSGDVQIVTTPCSPASRATQTFSLTREPLTFANGATVQFGVGAIPGTTYALQRLGTTTWTTIATGNGTTLGANRNDANFPRNATTQYRIVVNGTGEIVHSGITLQRDNLNTITAIAGVG